MKYNTLQDVQLKGKRALVRVDFNVPINDEGQITDDSRIQQSLPTIKFILSQGGSVILMSHLGRPGGKRVEELSLMPVARRLSELLKMDVAMAPDCIGEVVEKMASKLVPGQVLMLENLRFHAGEEAPEKYPDFVERLSRLGDLYINDAFAALHRKHASTYYIAKKMPVAACGFLIEKEVLILTNLLTQAKSPFYALIGGSKISSKIGMLEALLNKVDGLLIGGGMAYTFLKVMGYEVGNSLVDDAHLDTAKLIIKRAKNIDLQLPVDIVIAESLSNNVETRVVSIREGVPRGWLGADIGPETITKWKKTLEKANTIFWNGPVGIFELEPFKKGTQELAIAIADSNSISIVGGGDSASAVYQFGLSQKFTRISTGGGATLEFIEYGTLPGLEILAKK